MTSGIWDFICANAFWLSIDQAVIAPQGLCVCVILMPMKCGHGRLGYPAVHCEGTGAERWPCKVWNPATLQHAGYESPASTFWPSEEAAGRCIRHVQACLLIQSLAQENPASFVFQGGLCGFQLPEESSRLISDLLMYALQEDKAPAAPAASPAASDARDVKEVMIL